MTIKDILVHLDNSKSCNSRMDFALRMASAYDAHLTGLFVITQPEVPQFIQAQIDPSIIEAQYQAVRDSAKELETRLIEQAGAAGVEFECRSVEGELIETVSLHARYSDVTVIGQHDPDDDALIGLDDFPDRLVLTTGHPMFVVPYIRLPEKIGRHILVAWDASRLAARAVSDALPLLQNARKVEVLVINPHGGVNGHGDLPGADISLFLARHGVNAEAQHIATDDLDPANMLLSRVSDEGVDMVVMGAYGHRRLRELVLGGVTRYMLRHMTVPVFMSH